MKNEKLNLKEISVKSFNTSLEPKNASAILGGFDDSDCRTACRVDCQSAAESGCNSCGGTGGGGGTGYNCGTMERITCLVAC
ncbi:MAG: pinensin family lanthipeptide [Cyclobacteriaceae bacterium]